MTVTNYSPTDTLAWRNLETLSQAEADITITQLFDTETDRVERMSLQAGELFLDYSKNRVSQNVLQQLIALANESNLFNHRDAMFCGDPINSTEKRAVLHAALRSERADLPSEQGQSRNAMIKQQLEHVRQVSDKVRDGSWQGSTGKSITDVVNIGIGGSDLGPKLACTALSEFSHPSINVHFIANVDGAEILTTLASLDPETTLVAIASKTFTTQETLLNAKTTLNWFEEKIGLKDAQTSTHFIALTANPTNALAYGIPESQILEFAEWVGGRYSLWSSIGLSIAITIGFQRFSEMLAGAREMDLHFQSAPIDQNMPVILALLGIWYSNFLGAQSTAVIPYLSLIHI